MAIIFSTFVLLISMFGKHLESAVEKRVCQIFDKDSVANVWQTLLCLIIASIDGCIMSTCITQSVYYMQVIVEKFHTNLLKSTPMHLINCALYITASYFKWTLKIDRPSPFPIICNTKNQLTQTGKVGVVLYWICLAQLLI